ncbi:MAG: STAS domain-containing protein, partial [Oscillospiraceae bacterium]|nr:STAS domain-containing protein [Oscillospiraceae bacterium]
LADVTALTFDLAGLTYISSAGLRILLSAQKLMNKQGTMTVRNVQPEIMEIFTMTGFDEILTIE